MASPSNQGTVINASYLALFVPCYVGYDLLVQLTISPSACCLVNISDLQRSRDDTPVIENKKTFVFPWATWENFVYTHYLCIRNWPEDACQPEFDHVLIQMERCPGGPPGTPDFGMAERWITDFLLFFQTQPLCKPFPMYF